ncbi:MAG: RT0821/Lpp0805 family surface protein [Pseudomonadota bacterium]|nr:RT0821/Lpp0805 family surface protein [Pseudomonadota bacterium]
MTIRFARFLLPLVVVSTVALASCQGQGPKQSGGTLIGAAAGGLLGSKFGSGKGKLVGTAIGVLSGAWLGGEIGKSLDQADRALMRKTSQHSMEKSKDGNTAKWNNPNNGNKGSVTPTKTYQTVSGQYCREYQQTVTVGGRTQEAYGTACRRVDGTWQIQN